MEADKSQDTDVAPARILIVEDEQIVALDLAATLQDLGYDVAGNVPSGEAAIEQAGATRPSLILMEIRPAGGIDGVEAAREIRKQANIPILYLSGHSDDSSLSHAESARASGYLVKPFKAPELRCAIEIALHKHKIDARLSESEARYRTLVESGLALVCTHDLRGNLHFINQAAAGSLGYGVEECLGRNIEEMLTPTAKPGFVDYLMKIREDHAATGKMRLLDKVGRERVWFFSNRLIQDSNGDQYVLGHAQDITQMMEMQQAFRDIHQAALETEKRLSRTDALTGVANRRAFYETGEVERKRAGRYGRPLSLAYVGLDNFKQVNDRSGHDTGDQVLVCVGEILQKNTRAEIVAARLGGDEFALLLPEAGQAAALSVINKLHGLLTRAMREKDWPVTFSIGVVTYDNPPESTEQMVQAADALMYKAKRQGKDRVASSLVTRRELYQPSGPPTVIQEKADLEAGLISMSLFPSTKRSPHA